MGIKETSVYLASGQSSPLLPENPCSSHSCPTGEECHLLRRPCILLCPLLASCRPVPPKHPLGREDLPMSLQSGASRGGNRRGKLPPEKIRSLVKGLSTGEIIQRPFFTNSRRSPSVYRVDLETTKEQKPLVFLSKSNVTEITLKESNTKKQLGLICFPEFFYSSFWSRGQAGLTKLMLWQQSPMDPSSGLFIQKTIHICK